MMGKRALQNHPAEVPSEEAQSAASHVLGHFNLPGGHVPGGFTSRLIALFQTADPSNRARLASAFPAIAAAIALMNDNDIDTLTQQARGNFSRDEEAL